VASRRRTREFVLQVLFASDVQAGNPLEMLEFLETHFPTEPEEGPQLSSINEEFAKRLIESVSNDKEVIDRIISKLSLHWKLSRINMVDRNILRMAIAELVNFPETPGRVILNEAIELGKRFGGDNSSAFINGILDRIHALEPRPTSSEELKNILAELDVSQPTD
jgi:transcription antitermination protein NusB